MKKIYLLLVLVAFSFHVDAQEKAVLKHTFIKVEPGNNYTEDLKTKFSVMAQKRIDAGYQSGWDLWEVVGSPQAPFTHMIVELVLMSQMEKEITPEWWKEMRSGVLPGMTDSDWRTFMSSVREKREIIGEAMSIQVADVKRDDNVTIPDEVVVVNWMKVKDGKFKTYEQMEKALYANGMNKKGLRTGWSLAKRIDKVGTDLYWNYFTVDWFSSYNDVIKTSVNTPSWDGDKNYQKIINTRDLRESVIIRKVISLK